VKQDEAMEEWDDKEDRRCCACGGGGAAEAGEDGAEEEDGEETDARWRMTGVSTAALGEAVFRVTSSMMSVGPTGDDDIGGEGVDGELREANGSGEFWGGGRGYTSPFSPGWCY
jgi:hypothetical protein